MSGGSKRSKVARWLRDGAGLTHETAELWLDEALDEHAHELAEKQRVKVEEYESYGEVDRAESWIEAANSIDPKVSE